MTTTVRAKKKMQTVLVKPISLNINLKHSPVLRFKITSNKRLKKLMMIYLQSDARTNRVSMKDKKRENSAEVVLNPVTATLQMTPKVLPIIATRNTKRVIQF